MNNKTVFLDVDGTMVNYEGELPNSAVIAIREARKNGHKVYMCTGRSKAEIPESLWDIGLDGLIGGNGSYVEHNGETVMHQLMTYDQCKRVVDWLKGRNIEFYLESNNGLFASENFDEASKPVFEAYCAGKNLEAKPASELLHGLVIGGNLYRDDLNKVSFILGSYQDHLDSITEFPDLKAGTWGGKGELALFGDLGVNGISKATAVNAILEHNGSLIEDTLAFGDAKIDIPMLECCEIGVAMGNGGEEIKAMADFITNDVDEDGLYNAFKHFGLI